MITIETPSVVRRIWQSVLALGVLTFVLGAVVLVWPGDSIVVASVAFGVYLLVSGIAQVIAAFTVNMSLSSRVLFFISGALSVVVGYFAFRDFNDGAAVLAIEIPALPDRGWYAFVGNLNAIAGVVTLAWPISAEVVWALSARPSTSSYGRGRAICVR